MWSVEVVLVLPLLESVVEQLRVVDDDADEHLVELFGVDAVRSFYLAVEPGGGRIDVDVADASVQDVPIEAVANTINSRPRKTLGWKTPAEALDEHLRSLQQAGVATTD